MARNIINKKYRLLGLLKAFIFLFSYQLKNGKMLLGKVYKRGNLCKDIL